MSIRPCLAALTCLALAACNDTKPASPPEPAAEETGAQGGTETGEQASIIRPDIEVARTQDVAPLEVSVGFGDSGSELSAEAVTALSQLLESPQVAQFSGAITVRGHSDAGGNDAANLKMSQERADAVAGWLIENGIAEARITTIAFGEQNPLQPNALPDGSPNEPGRAANRRVDVHVAVPPGATIPTPAEPAAPVSVPGKTGSLLRPAQGS